MSKFRARRQWVPLVAGFGLMLATLGFAFGAAQAIPALSDEEVMTHELAVVRQERRLRIAQLLAATAPCELRPTRELAQLLAMDGQFDAARALAIDFEEHCGADPVVHTWGYAPRPRPRRHVPVE